MSLGNTLLNIFAKSPFQPTVCHMDLIHKCVVELEKFFVAALALDWKLAEQHHANILKYESDADKLKKDIRLHLPNSLFLPVSRGDLLSLLTAQDKIASKVKHITGLVIHRRMKIPTKFQTKFTKFYQRGIMAVSLAKKAIGELEELVDTGFKGREVKLVTNLVSELEKVEHDTDNLQINMRQSVFKVEQELNAIDAIFLYKLIDWVSEIADRAQQVGQRLELLLAR